jgi:hypothetical protein
MGYIFKFVLLKVILKPKMAAIKYFIGFNIQIARPYDVKLYLAISTFDKVACISS